MYGGRLEKLEAGVGALVSVGVAVADARAIPWSGYKCPHPSFKCLEPAAVHIKMLPRSIPEGVRTRITKINDNMTTQIRAQN